jgi:hypothetical protein
MDQYGGSLDNIGPLYHAGFRIQRGGGIGNFLGGLYRLVRPLFVKSARAIGREALNTGSSILSDIATKSPHEKVGAIVRKRMQETVNRNMTGSGRKRKRARRQRRQKTIKKDRKGKRGQSSRRARAVKRKKHLTRDKTDIFMQ